MPLSDRIKQPAPAPVHGSPCSIGEVYAALAQDPTETAALNTLLYELGYTARQVYDELTAEGHKVGFQSVNRHRGKRCRCFMGGAA